MEFKGIVKKGQLDGNFEIFKNQIVEYVEPFKDLVFQEEDVAKAKNTMAELRRQVTAIEDTRKDIKNQWMAPYLDFEKKVKEVVAIIDETIVPIKVQIQSFDDRRIMDKYNKSQEIKAKVLEEMDMADIVNALSWFDDPKWHGLSISLKAIEGDVREKCEKIKADINTMYSVPAEHFDGVYAVYSRAGNLNMAMDHYANIVKQRQAMQELKDKQELAELARATQEAQEVASPLPSRPEPVPVVPPVVEEPRKSQGEAGETTVRKAMYFTIRIKADIDQIKALKIYCQESGIEFVGVNA